MSLFVVQAHDDGEPSLVAARFIKDGFSWPAFVFGGVWLLYHRLWLPLVVYLVLDIVFVLLAAPHLPGAATVAVGLLARLFIALEGARWRQGKNARAMTINELVEARDRDEAEAIFYARHRPAAGGLPA